MSVEKLFELRYSLHQLESDLGITNLTEIEKSVYAFIASNKKCHIKAINNHRYFENISLSSVNRCISSLIKKSLIEKHSSELDRRVNYLRVLNG